MRQLISLVFVCLSFSLVSAQKKRRRVSRRNNRRSRPLRGLPRAEADAVEYPRPLLPRSHTELERVLSPQMLAEIDAMPSEGGMIQYHMGLGLRAFEPVGGCREARRWQSTCRNWDSLTLTRSRCDSRNLLVQAPRAGLSSARSQTPAYWEAIEAAQKARQEREQETRVQKAKARCGT